MSQRDVAGNRLGIMGDCATPHENRLYKLAKRAEKGRDKYALRALMHHAEYEIDARADQYEESAGIKLAKNAVCGKMRGQVVSLRLTREYGSAVFGQAYHCGNVWLCPDCQATITAHRGDEVQQLPDWAIAHGKQVVFLTYTAAHNANMPLKEFGGRLQKAYRAYWNRKGIRRMIKRCGMKVDGLERAPRIKVTEYTHSFSHRWHKHFHVLVVADMSVDMTAYIKDMQEMWVSCCVDYGLCADNEQARADLMAHGLDIKVAKSAEQARKFARYMAKEISSSAVKVSRATDREEHHTIWELAVGLAVAEHDCPADAPKYRDAIAEYAYYTRGKAQMVWSAGLKAAVGVADVSDEALVDSQDDDTAETVCGLLRPAWQYVQHNVTQQELKDIALSGGGIKAVAHYFAVRGIADAVISADMTDLVIACETGEYTVAQQGRELEAETMLGVCRAINDACSDNTYYQAPPILGRKPVERYTQDEKMSIMDSRTTPQSEWLRAVSAEFRDTGVIA